MVYRLRKPVLHGLMCLAAACKEPWRKRWQMVKSRQ
jgi:hypothetical protein